MSRTKHEQDLEAFELKPEEIEGVTGGSGGSSTKLPPMPGFDVYRIKPGDTLGKIAQSYGTTADYLKKINPTIHNIYDITAGYYIYVPWC